MSIFLEKTIQLLKERPKTLTFALIAEETELTSGWLESLLYKKNPNPSVIQLEILYNYLNGEPFSFNSGQHNQLNNEE